MPLVLQRNGFAWQVPTTVENQPILITGQVQSLPERDNDSTRFQFHLQTFNHVPLSENVTLNGYQFAPLLIPGQQWQLRVKLKNIRGFADPGAFDYEAHALAINIRATGEVQNSKDNRLLATPTLSQALNRFRQLLAHTIAAALPSLPYQAMISALVMGDKTGITQDQWQVLQRTGTNHLMVIAGLHIGMLSGLAFALCSWLWRRSERLLLGLPAQQAAAAMALLVAVGYSLLAGFSIPTQRAVVMLGVFMWALLAKRRLTPGAGLACALLLVLIARPLGGIGYWLLVIVCCGQCHILRHGWAFRHTCLVAAMGAITGNY